VNCRNWIIELVECARTGVEPGAELREHLEQCAQCRERWDDEKNLSARFQIMRATATARRQSQTKREEVMREFQSAHQTLIPASIKWLLGVAAVVLLAITLGRAWQNDRAADTTNFELTETPQADSNSVATAEIPPGEEFSQVAELNRGTEDDSFLPVPYAPPLATGEFVRVVRTELRPIALARMGIDVDSYPDEIAADVVLGEDGFPRAVRLLEEKQF
jgi:predicted anti-sigma-YlaC factor YlaD